MKNILDKASYLYMLNIINRRPLDINIETISMCPMKCVFCCNRLYKRDYVVMDNQLFRKIIFQYCSIWGGGTIGIGSMQSDFFSDPLLLERIKIIRQYKKKLWVHSTTPLISCKRYNDEELLRILECFDYLVISALGYDKVSYQEMAGIDGFHIFDEQLERLKRIIVNNNLKIKIDIAFRTSNKQALRRSTFYRKVSNMFSVSDIKDSFFSWFGSIKKEDLPHGAKLLLKDNKGIRENCVVPNATLAIQADGKVVGCGCIDWLEKYVIGDVYENTLIEIWKSSKTKKFRNAFCRGKIPTICRECGLYVSIHNCLEKKRLLGYKSKDGLYYCVEK